MYANYFSSRLASVEIAPEKYVGIVLCGGYNYYSTGVLQLIKGQ